MREPGVFEQLVDWQADAIVVAAFGQILRKNVLDLTEFGCINVHASYLPRWRGAAPIQAAILSGDEFTGVSIMKLDSGIDTGPVFAQRKVPILENDTAETLEMKLSREGSKLLLETLPEIFPEGWFHSLRTIPGQPMQPCCTRKTDCWIFRNPPQNWH